MIRRLNNLKNMKKTYLLLLFVVLFMKGFSQEQDMTLSLDQFLEIVKLNHPTIKQVLNDVEMSEAKIIGARSDFEPSINGSYSEKVFGEEQYYQSFNPEVRIPTWFGIEAYGGINNLEGNKYNQSSTFGESSYVGVSIPLLKNLLMDSRRATLKQSKLFLQMSNFERDVVVNDLLMSAIESYWEYVNSYELMSVINENLANSQKRLDFIRKSYFNGEKAEIDTIEASNQYQMFSYKRNDAEIRFMKSRLNLSTFLWKNDNIPYELPQEVSPNQNWKGDLKNEKVEFILNKLLEASQVHPIVKTYELKREVLDIEKQLKFQSLLPKLDLYYNHLGKGYDVGNTLNNHRYFDDNFQTGVKFELPILLMKGRSDYKIANLKLINNDLDLIQKQNQINLKVKSYYNEYEILKRQLDLQYVIYDNYNKLVKAEEQKLMNGESSLFIVNSRQMKALDALEKLINIQAKYFKTIYAIQWSVGSLK